MGREQDWRTLIKRVEAPEPPGPVKLPLLTHEDQEPLFDHYPPPEQRPTKQRKPKPTQEQP